MSASLSMSAVNNSVLSPMIGPLAVPSRHANWVAVQMCAKQRQLLRAHGQMATAGILD